MSDINNGARRAIEYLVYGALPPHSTKVLWMDTSVPELPVLKIFWNGCWTPVHTDESKEIDLLVKTVYAQQETINQLENKIETTTEETKEVVEKLDEEKLSAFTLANAILSGGTKINLIHIHHVAIPGDHCPFTQNAPALRTGREFEVEIGREVHTRIEWVVEGSVFLYSDSDTAGEPVYTEKDATERRWVLTIANPEAFRLSSAADIQSIIGNNSEATNSEILHTLLEAQQTIDQDVAKTGTDSTVTLTTIKSLLQSLVDAHVINNVSLDGYVFEDNYNVQSIGDLIFNLFNIESINDDRIISASVYNPFTNRCIIKEVILPNLRQLTDVQNRMFYSNTTIRKFYIPKINSFTATDYTFYACTNLIDLMIGENITSNLNLYGWAPGQALRSDVATLVEPGESFSNNLEKLLYNIREHIAALLPDRTGDTALTITFYSSVKAAIQADATTLAAFTNKNWTIA